MIWANFLVSSRKWDLCWLPERSWAISMVTLQPDYANDTQSLTRHLGALPRRKTWFLFRMFMRLPLELHNSHGVLHGWRSQLSTGVNCFWIHPFSVRVSFLICFERMWGFGSFLPCFRRFSEFSHSLLRKDFWLILEANERTRSELPDSGLYPDSCSFRRNRVGLKTASFGLSKTSFYRCFKLASLRCYERFGVENVRAEES